MAEQQLVDYIKNAKEAGQADEQIRSVLGKNGWSDAEINEAFLATNSFSQKPQQQPTERLQSTVLPATKSNKRLIVLLAVLFVLIGVGAYSYYGQYSIPKPKAVSVKTSVTKTKKSSSTSKPPATNKKAATPKTTVKKPFCHTFNNNLGVASSGNNDVYALHTALSKEKISFAPDTGKIYADGTTKAVVQFQTKYGIAPASGFVGNGTRAELNKLYACKTKAVPPTPVQK